MRITLHASKRETLMKLKLSACLLVNLIILAFIGCQTIPRDALKLSPESLEKRALQTRKYEGISEKDILSASAGVIQDLGFNIDESETKLGVIVGSKERSALAAGQAVTAILVAAMSGDSASIEKNQKLRVSLVVRPTPKGNDKKHFVRVTFQRMVWDTQGKITRIEGLDQLEIYQEFFDRLSKAVFLEGHKI